MAASLQSDDTQKNKKLVADFFTLAFVEKKVEAAFDNYVGDNYIQHDPNFPDKSATISALSRHFSNPQMSVSIKRVIAENDLVVIHLHSKNSPEDTGIAIIEIFRVDKGKIVEHWGVMQTVPEASANDNTMF
jgi:predicted SnoaL-like aldol condensation-catalyzing enzyme